MIDLANIDPDVLDALRHRGHGENGIARMSPDEAFDEFCMWHGLVGWGPTLRRVMRNLAQARPVSTDPAKE